MTTTPPPHPPQQSYDRPYYGPPMLGLPGNPEFYFVVIAWVVILIVTLAADSVDWPTFVTATIVLAGAYILSRGIAKAGKVFEQ
jgi:hypothetical protein